MALTVMSSPKEETMREPSMRVPKAPKPQYGVGQGIKVMQYHGGGNKSVVTNWRRI